MLTRTLVIAGAVLCLISACDTTEPAPDLDAEVRVAGPADAGAVLVAISSPGNIDSLRSSDANAAVVVHQAADSAVVFLRAPFIPGAATLYLKDATMAVTAEVLLATANKSGNYRDLSPSDFTVNIRR